MFEVGILPQFFPFNLTLILDYKVHWALSLHRMLILLPLLITT
jgi:hypothetical protein